MEKCTNGLEIFLGCDLGTLNDLFWIKGELKNDLCLCRHCKSRCSTVPVMRRGGNNGDEYNRLFHRLSFPGHLILSGVFKTFPTELMITDCHIILFMVTCFGRCQKFCPLKAMG